VRVEQRRTKQGKAKKKIIRSLKRYIAREIYAQLKPATTPNHLPTAA
jgi:hypothetical protein